MERIPTAGLFVMIGAEPTSGAIQVDRMSTSRTVRNTVHASGWPRSDGSAGSKRSTPTRQESGRLACSRFAQAR